MKLIVGLGNPGPEYATTRHNIGFRVLDLLAGRLGLEFGPVRRGCSVAGDPAGAGPVLVKPLTYMNRSGEALAGWAKAAGLPLDAAPAEPPQPDEPDGSGPPAEPPSAPAGESAGLLVICDDINLPLGSLRLRARGGDGGHRGLESIVRALGGEEFPRLRLGVAGADWRPQDDWADYVLGDFTEPESGPTDELVAVAADAAECWLAEGSEAAAGRFNRRAARGAADTPRSDPRQ